MQDLNILYSPTCWTKRKLTPQEVMELHLTVIEKASKEAIENIPCELNIEYGPLESEKLDIYGTDLREDAPIFVFIHGGYWQMKEITRKSYAFVAVPLYKKGIKTIFIGYEQCPDVTLPDIVREIEVAVKRCIIYARKRQSRGLYLCGHSAGAHLVTYLFTNFTKTLPEDDRKFIKAVIPVSGVFDLLPLLETEYNKLLQMDEDTALAMSPLKQPIHKESAKKVSFHLVVGADESPEFLKQSKKMYDKLIGLGAEVWELVVKDADHFNILENLSDKEFVFTKYILNVILPGEKH